MKAFGEMRAVLMNCPIDYIDELDVRLQQRGIAKSAGMASEKAAAKPGARLQQRGSAKSAGVVPKKAAAWRQKAPVERERMHRPDRLAQECVGQDSQDKRRVSWDWKVKRKIIWDSLPYRTKQGRRTYLPGRGGLVAHQ